MTILSLNSTPSISLSSNSSDSQPFLCHALNLSLNQKTDKKAVDSPGAQILKLADKNNDGALTIDEYEEKDRQYFQPSDTNKDGRVDVQELDAAIKKLTDGAKN